MFYGLKTVWGLRIKKDLSHYSIDGEITHLWGKFGLILVHQNVRNGSFLQRGGTIFLFHVILCYKHAALPPIHPIPPHRLHLQTSMNVLTFLTSPHCDATSAVSCVGFADVSPSLISAKSPSTLASDRFPLSLEAILHGVFCPW